MELGMNGLDNIEQLSFYNDVSATNVGDIIRKIGMAASGIECLNRILLDSMADESQHNGVPYLSNDSARATMHEIIEMLSDEICLQNEKLQQTFTFDGGDA